MPYVERDTHSEIIAIYAREQPGIAEEYLAEDHPDWVAYLLSIAIDKKIQAVNNLRNQKMSEDFTHGGKIFDAGPSAQSNIANAITYGQLNTIPDGTSRTWVLVDNSTVNITWGELRAMATALFDRADGYHAHARVHKDTIGLMEEIANVEAYDITENWIT